MKPIRLAVVTTHPIQYYAPQLKLLAQSRSIHPRVFFTWSQTAAPAVADPGFGRAIAWDIPLLEGYEHEFVPNLARRPGPGRFRGVRTPSLCRRICAWGADAVLVYGWNSHSHLTALRHFKGRIPVFFRGDSTLLDASSPWHAAARRLLLRWIYRHVDVAIAVGSNNRDYFRWCGVSDERIAFAPHAIDTARFALLETSQARRVAQWREEFGIRAGERVILFAGKLIEKKDPRLLLEAFLCAGAAGHLLFVGDGAQGPLLHARARGRADVHFLPFQNQQLMPAVYRLGDAFVLPSRGPGETWGLALNEAMAAGRPVIASDKVGGARDLVSQSTGWMFAAGDLGQLSAHLRTALTCDSATLEGMGAAAQRLSGQWSLDAAVAGIEQAISQRCAGKPPVQPPGISTA